MTLWIILALLCLAGQQLTFSRLISQHVTTTHQWNVRVARGVLSPIDFEDMLWGWPVQDIGIALYYYLGEDNYPDLRDAFQRGYQRIAVWPENEPGQIDAFIAARAVMLMNFLLGTIDPHWQEMVPDYARRTEKRIRILMN